MDAVETNRNTSRILAVLESRAPDIHGDPEISARIVRDTFASLYTDPPRTMRELLAVERMLTMQPIEQISRDALDLIGRALVPAARQLGMWRTAQHVEDACFATLASGEERREVADAQTAIAQGNRAYLPVARDISDLLQQSGLSATAAVQSHSISTLVQSRRPLSSGSKHPCFISLSVDGDEQHCYAALALLHRHWPHIGTQLRDYVGQPKANGYRSIHTVLKIESAARASRNDLEVHLQTLKHEELNVRGIDAYLSIPELRALPGPRPWYAEVPLEEPKDDQMHVFTPAAEQISIACGATILDFAFKLHSELGIHYKRGKINGRIVPRGHELAAGDLCEVDVDPLTAQPAANWENTVRTAAARQAIRTWRNRQARSVSELHDLHQRISDEIAKRGIVVSERAIKDELQLMARERNLDSVALLVDHIREGRLSVKEIAWRLVSRPLLDRLDPSSCELFREFLTDGAIRLAACCQPTYRSAAVAALSRKRTVLTVHRTDCKRVRGGAECAPISWRPEGGRELFCEVSMVAFDRPGLLADVLDVIGARATDDGQVPANISWLEMKTAPGGSGKIAMHVSLPPGLKQSNLTSLLKGVQGYRTSEARTVASYSFHAGPPTRNPYLIGRPRTDRVLTSQERMTFGREAELASLSETLVWNPVPGCAIVYGPRRVGKTTLLVEFRERCSSQEHQEIIPAYVTAHSLDRNSNEHGDAVVAQAIADAVQGAIEERRGITIERFDADRAGGQPSKALLEYLDGEVRRSLLDERLVLCLDEFGTLIRWFNQGIVSEDAIRGLQVLCRELDYIGLVVAMPDSVLEAWNHFMLRFDVEAVPISLGELDRESAISLIRDPLPTLKYDQKAVECILRMTKCHPWLIHLVCYEIVESAMRLGTQRVAAPYAEQLVEELSVRLGQRRALSVFYREGNESIEEVAFALARLTRKPDETVTLSALAIEVGWAEPELAARLHRFPGLVQALDERGGERYRLRYPMVWCWAKKALG